MAMELSGFLLFCVSRESTRPTKTFSSICVVLWLSPVGVSLSLSFSVFGVQIGKRKFHRICVYNWATVKLNDDICLLCLRYRDCVLINVYHRAHFRTHLLCHVRWLLDWKHIVWLKIAITRCVFPRFALLMILFLILLFNLRNIFLISGFITTQ